MFLTVFFCCLANYVWSGETTVVAKQDSARQGKKLDTKKRKKDMKLFLDKIEILGRIDKPQTAFIVQGKDPSVDDIRIDRSFFREIFRPVDVENIRKIIRKPSLTGINKPK